LGSTVFDRSDLDVPEQQLALAYTIDYDLDNFAAAVGFARQTVYSLTQEPGKLSRPSIGRLPAYNADISIEVGSSSLEIGVYEPVQKILDQVKNVKISSRWVSTSQMRRE
jgi:dynactin 1